MSSDTKNIKEKIALLCQYIQDVEYRMKLVDAHATDDVIIGSIERAFQLMVDEAVDINIVMITESGNPVPDYNQPTFEALAKIGVIPEDLMLKISGSVGLRNKLVHRYDMVQKNVFLSEVAKYLELYKAFLQKLIAERI